MNTVHGEPSFHLGTPELEFSVTVRGGHLAPVVFHLPGRDVLPYSLSPWTPDEFPDQPVLLSVLRGDFFCLPFGEQEDGPPHGDPANARWTLDNSDSRSLTLLLQSTDTSARIKKTHSVRDNQHAIYTEHEISNLDGNFNYGTHPILDLSHLPEGAGRVSVSAFHWGSVFPGVFANPEAGETQALAESSTFTDLREVTLASGGSTDLTRYPQRLGNEDLVMMANSPSTSAQPFAWSAVVLDGYLWFSLKNPSDFPATLFWMSNRGRTAPPWNDRHIARIGIEEVCSYFCHGLEKSRQNLLKDQGIPTTRLFERDKTVSLRTIQAVAPTKAEFGTVVEIVPQGDHHVSITDEKGTSITAKIDWTFLLEQKS